MKFRHVPLALLLSVAACSVHLHGRDRHVVVHEVKIAEPPPPPPRVVVVRGTRPGAKHVWVDGHYEVRNGRYVWVNGHWLVPPKGRSHWVKGYWKRTPGGGIWVAAHWR